MKKTNQATVNQYPVFRPLRADEVEIRIGNVDPKGVTLILYKDQRADVRILNETVGPSNWQNTYPPEFGGKVCVLEIWDPEKQCWIKKSNFGSESRFEPEKSLASDSFKRACFNWAIGSELYTLKDIFVEAKWCNITTTREQKLACYDDFVVEHFIVSEEKKIEALTIWNKSNGKRVFVYDNRVKKEENEKTVNDSADAPMITVTPKPEQKEVKEIPQTVKKADGVPISLPEGVKPNYSVDLEGLGEKEEEKVNIKEGEIEYEVGETKEEETVKNPEEDETSETANETKTESETVEESEPQSVTETEQKEVVSDEVEESESNEYTEDEWNAFLKMEVPFKNPELIGKTVKEVLDEAENNPAYVGKRSITWAATKYSKDEVFQRGCIEAVRRYGW